MNAFRLPRGFLQKFMSFSTSTPRDRLLRSVIVREWVHRAPSRKPRMTEGEVKAALLLQRPLPFSFGARIAPLAMQRPPRAFFRWTQPA